MSKEACLKLAKRIKSLRKKKDWSQEKLAEKAGITLRHVQRLESASPPGVALNILDDIAKAFGVSLPSLVTFD